MIYGFIVISDWFKIPKIEFDIWFKDKKEIKSNKESLLFDWVVVGVDCEIRSDWSFYLCKIMATCDNSSFDFVARCKWVKKQLATANIWVRCSLKSKLRMLCTWTESCYVCNIAWKTPPNKVSLHFINGFVVHSIDKRFRLVEIDWIFASYGNINGRFVYNWKQPGA